MILDGNQRRELHKAIIDAFSESDLKSLVLFEFGTSLENITTGENLPEKVLALIVHCEHEGRECLECLIKAAYKEKPRNENLKQFHDKYFQISVSMSDEDESFTNKASASEAKAYRFPEVGDFDLVELIEFHIDPVLTTTNAGLIGIAIPCESEEFRIRFGQRLKTWIKSKSVNPEKRRKVNKVGSRDLHPHFGPAEKVAKAIYTTCKDHLSKKRDVIYSVKVRAEGKKDSSYANKFWQLLESEFHQFSFESRLIIFMNGIDATIFPDCVNKFPVPKFDIDHVGNWILPFANNSVWGDSFWRGEWIKCMRIKCICPERSILIIERVYTFLDKTVELLLDEDISDKKEFIEELEYNIRSHD